MKKILEQFLGFLNLEGVEHLNDVEYFMQDYM